MGDMETDKDKASKRKLSASSSGAGAGEEDNGPEIEETEFDTDTECDVWDDDCKILRLKLRSRDPVVGYHLMPTCGRDPEETPNKKTKVVPEMNKNLLDKKFKKAFQAAWSKNKAFENDHAELILSPFKVCVVKNLLENPAFLKDVKAEFSNLEWNMRSMDLYEFTQSKDLKDLTQHENISAIGQMLANSVKKWVADLTGFKLTNMSATCSLYNQTDYLLVHDDQKDDRMVAFVLYLNDDWHETYGGILELFGKDADGHPTKPVREIVPEYNQLVFFPVTNDSYHQVTEVTTLVTSRFTINGWFHTDEPPQYITPPFKPYPEGIYSTKSYKVREYNDTELSHWIHPAYLAPELTKEVQSYFETHSEICLKKLLNMDNLEELIFLLQEQLLSWIKIGPPNRYCYEVVDPDDIPGILKRFYEFLQSKQMFAYLKSITNCDFNENSSVQFELQKWTPGSYTLLGDYEWYEKKQLDMIVHFDCDAPELTFEVRSPRKIIGARTQYVTTDEEVQEALITLEPEDTHVNLIYRDTARFTKYFSKLSKCKRFYKLICSYTE